MVTHVSLTGHIFSFSRLRTSSSTFYIKGVSTYGVNRAVKANLFVTVICPTYKQWNILSRMPQIYTQFVQSASRKYRTVEKKINATLLKRDRHDRCSSWRSCIVGRKPLFVTSQGGRKNRSEIRNNAWSTTRRESIEKAYCKDRVFLITFFRALNTDDYPIKCVKQRVWSQGQSY